MKIKDWSVAIGLEAWKEPGEGPVPAVGGELRSLGSNERHEAGLRRLEVAGEDPDR